MRIGIAGVGGIGSNVALHLVRSGVKELKFVDFDRVQETNLNRQFYFYDQIGELKTLALEKNLKKIVKDLDISLENCKITEENIEEIFKDCDIVIEGFDKSEDKAMLIRKLADRKKLIVSANGVAGIDSSGVSIKKISNNVYIVGDFSSDVSDVKLYSHKVNLISSLMAEIVLKKLENNK